MRLNKIDKIRNYFIEEINQNDLTSKKHKNVCMTLIYIEQLLIIVSVVIRFVSISAFASFVGFPIGIVIPAVGLKNWAKGVGIKKYKSIIKKKKTHKQKIVLLAG